MPVRKFHSVAEMTPITERTPRDPDNLRIAMALSQTCLELGGKKFPTGVTKHRSVEERPTK